MHPYLLIWRGTGGKYHVIGYHQKEDAYDKMREMWRQRGVIDATVVST